MENKQKTKWSSIENRIILYSLEFFLVFAAIFYYFVFSKNGAAQTAQSPFCVDFGLFYAAGKMTLSGNAAQIYDIPLHHAVVEQIFNAKLPFNLPWLYPPIFLLAIVPFALLPFHLALVLWLLATLALALYAVYRMLPSRKGLAVVLLGFPGVLMNLRWGQNGFLSAALLAFSIGFLETNPLLSGAMIGLLAYKPQFAFLPFVILLLSKKWKAVRAAVCSAVVVAIVSIVLFGVEPWVQFIGSFFHASASLSGTEQQAIAAIQNSPYSALFNLWADSRISMVGQGVVTVSVILAVRWVWKHTARLPLKGAMLVLGIPLSIPYFLQYDLAILALPLVLLVYDFFEHGCSKTEFALTALLWMLPLINWPTVIFTSVQLSPLVLIAVSVMVLLRVKREEKGQPLRQTTLANPI